MTRKILVEIISNGQMKSKKLKVSDEGNAVIIKKGGRGRGDVKLSATFDRYCLVTYRVGRIFKKLKQKLYLIAGAKECISFQDKTATFPLFDAKAVSSLFKSNVLKAAGTARTKLEIPGMMWAFILIILALQVVNLVIGSGNVRFTS